MNISPMQIQQLQPNMQMQQMQFSKSPQTNMNVPQQQPFISAEQIQNMKNPYSWLAS